MTILLVDDSTARMMIHSMILRDQGFKIIEAENGTDGIRLAQEQNPDIILLDVVLPDINGVDVCRQLKTDPKTQHMLVMLISSIEIKSLHQSRGLDSGADGYLTLPVSNEELISRVRAFERIKRSEDELRRSHQLLQQHSDELERINRELQNEITEHQRTESALRVSEEYARSIINCSHDMIISVDNERQIVEFNDSAQRTFGYTREEVSGKHISILYADPEEGMRLNKKTIESGSVSGEVRNRKKSGELFTSRLSASVLRNDKKELLGLVGVSRDVTKEREAEEALMESEERYRLLFTQSPLGILHIDNHGVLLNANAIAIELFGIPWDQTLPITIDDLIQQPALLKTVKDSLNGIPGSYQGSFTTPSSSKEFTIRIITRPVLTKGRTADSVIAIVEDITEQTIVQRQLIQSQKLESLGTLAGGIAHDFNNLLALILGNAELVRKNIEQDSKLLKFVNNIIEVAHRGGSISKQMLLFSRKSEFSLLPISLAVIIEEMRQMLQHFIPKTIDIKTSVEGTNDYIQCDKGHIHQVIINLCINAKDAMGDQGTLTITEKVVPSSSIDHLFSNIPSGNYVSLAVSDTGPGIDSEMLKKIFDPFFTTKEKGKGTGLGLSIVDGIVRSHNGFINVQSSKNEGTTFTLYFPAVTPSRHKKASVVSTDHYKGKRFLIVDDEPLLVQVLGETLTERGCSVISAGDGNAALELYRSRAHEIDLVISDLDMPAMNGETMYHELKKINSAVQVVIASGYLDPDIRSKLKQDGIQHIITKPYKTEEIFQVLQQVFTPADR